jgi:hypothetical protein
MKMKLIASVRASGRWPPRVVKRRFLGELIALEDRLSRGYGDGQAEGR